MSGSTPSPSYVDRMYDNIDLSGVRTAIQTLRSYAGDLPSDTSANTAIKNDILSQIAYLEREQVNLSAANISTFRTAISEIRRNLINQLAVVGVTQHQLDELNRFAGKYGEERVGKQRMIALNSYYGKKYMAQKELMQLIILTCVPLLILALLVKYGTIPANIASMVGAIILVVGIFFVGRKFLDIMTRSKLNFDEYDWQFSPKSSTSGDDYQPSPSGSISKLSLMGCYNGNCCDSETMDYDEATGKCIVKIATPPAPAAPAP